MTEQLTRTFYPWEELTTVGDSFKIDTSNPRGIKYCRQLTFLRNKKMEKFGRSERYVWTRDGLDIVISRVK